MINYNKFVENSRKWLKEYIQNNHLQSIICGISGGIDSTVSCAIVSSVCRELNIPLIGRSLPTGTNKQSECTVANMVGNAFCTDYKVISINCNDIIHEFEICEGKMTALQKGNIKARYRMMYLYNLASIHKGIVLDNDNFTEWNLGFWTLKGDEGDINLGLHYLWKTEIYELADYLCTEYMQSTIPIKDSKQSEAIKASMALIPTDGNGVSSSDCEQFGLDNYAQVDDVLKTMYYRKPDFISEEQYNKMCDQGVILIDTTKEISDKEYIRLINSYNEQGVDKVMLLHQNTAYKRKKLPIKPTREELGI